MRWIEKALVLGFISGIVEHESGHLLDNAQAYIMHVFRHELPEHIESLKRHKWRTAKYASSMCKKQQLNKLVQINRNCIWNLNAILKQKLTIEKMQSEQLPKPSY